MALSNQAPMPAKVKPVPPPKPISQQNQNPRRQSLIEVQSEEGFTDVEKSMKAPSSLPIVGLRGRPASDLNAEAKEERSGNLHNPHKPPSKHGAFLISDSPLKCFSDEGNSVNSKKVIISGDNSHSFPTTQASVQQTVGKTKPPLLPKPASERISFQFSPKPPIPKRPHINPLIRKNFQESGTQTNASGRKVTVLKRATTFENSAASKSSFSSLQHFESVVSKDGCENPVRPPRSPKNKPFSGMPFEFVDSKQNISAKQKNFSLPQSARQNAPIWAFWECNSGVISDEKGVTSQRVVQAKSCSLERNVGLFSHENFASRSGNFAVGLKNPIPPPRRVKKKSDIEANVLSHSLNANGPVYAVVNYELKKNRRSLVVSDEDAKNSVGNQVSSDISVTSVPQAESNFQEGYFTKKSTNDSCEIQSNNIGTTIQEVEKSSHSENTEEDGKCKPEDLNSLDKFVVDCTRDYNDKNVELKYSTVKKESCDCDYSVQHIDTMMQKESISSQPVQSETEVINNAESTLCNERSKGNYEKESFFLHNSPKEDNKLIVEESCAEFIIEGSSPLREVDGDVSESKNEITVVINELPSTFDKVANNTLEIQGIDKIDSSAKPASSFVTTQSENENTSAVPGLCRCTCKMYHPPLESNGQLRGFLSKTSSESDCSLCALENKRSGSGDDMECKLSQTSSLPLRSKFNVTQGRSIDPCRRQSWSDGQKKESKASNTTVSGKQSRKKKGRSLWCDEGDLSSGTLGDQSSFEDVPMEETSEVSPVCRRLSALFSSFGKSSRKPRKQTEKAGKINSTFFCNSNYEDTHIKQGGDASDDKDSSLNSEALDLSSSSRLEIEPVEGSDKRLVEPEMEGVSDLCSKVDSLDLKRKTSEFGSESHLSEGSFENAPSESENEETTHSEDKLDSSLSASQRREKKAFYIAQELMTSENVFVDVLRLLCIDFRNAVLMAGAEEKSEIIPEVDLGKILNNLPQLLRFNEDLLHDLENRIHNWSSSQKIADIIVRKGPFLKLYTSYFQNFETQCQFLDEYCESNPRFAKVVRDFEASPRCQKLAVRHYMLKPIQRVPQYRLLLEDYLAHLESTSDDYEDTQVALSIVRDVADHANRSMKQGDAFSKLLQLQSLLKNYVIIKPGRTFLKEGELQKLCRKGMQSRYFILLNDCLLYATYEKPGSLKVNNELPLNGMKVEIPVAEDYTNEFSIISTTRSFTLSASSSQERSEWVNALIKAIQDHTSRQLSFLQVLAQDMSKQKKSEPFQLGTAAPVWIQDCRVTMCQCCTEAFTVTFRRHHCRACGKVVCGICSANKAPLQYMKFHTARVCDECYDSLLKDFDENKKNIQEAIQHEICSADFADTAHAFETIKASFKKLVPATTGRKTKRFIPQRLKEVCANDTGSQMSGWLHWRYRKSWKKNWFVLKEQVLYVYKASEDVVALESIPILGYQLIPTELESRKDDTVESGITFSLTHKGKHYLEFQADNVHSSKRWIHAMQEATVLK